VKNFKYILTHASGNLTAEYNPLNWNNFNIMFRRSSKYHSILRSQILDCEFPRDGKSYIDTIYETYGIDTEIGCEIQYLDKSDFSYATLFDGLIDLSEWVSLRDTTSVKIIDNSTLSKFMARDEIAVPINRANDLDGNAVASYTYLEGVYVEGVNIEERALYDDNTNEINITAVQSSNFDTYHGVTGDPWDVNTIGADAVLPAVSLPGASGVIYTNNTGATQSIRYRIVTAVQGTVTVTGSNAWTWGFQAWVGKNGATNPIFESASGTGSDFRGLTDSYDSGYIETTLAAGETLELYHRWYGTVTGGDTITPNIDVNPTLIDVYTVEEGESVEQIDMPMVHELGAKILEIITGQSDPLNAPLLGRTDSEPRTYVSDGDYSLIAVASGLILRSFAFSDYPLKSSFSDFFKSLDAVGNLGLWYDQENSEFVIAAKEDFYRTDKIITLGEVQELEISIATDHYFNKVLTGYQKEIDYEAANGQQVPNVPGSFANDIQRIEGELDIRSVYRGDDYGIELSRKSKFAETAGEDMNTDNDNFMIYGRRLAGSVYTSQGYDDFTTITGVYSPSTRLNLDITPKRNMLRHKNQLSIPLFISNGDTNYMETQYELNLSTQKAAESAINEKDDLAYSDLSEPLYYPEIYNFTADLTIDIILQIISDPHGYVEFDYLGVTYSGYILEVSSEPFNRRGNWTLLKRNPNRS
jgi:hypothetical protein